MKKLDFESMTLAEIEQIEVLTGRNIESIMADGAPRGVALKAIIWTLRRRENPGYTLEDAGKVSLKEATALFTDADDEKKD
jgi:hypothetical protein